MAKLIEGTVVPDPKTSEPVHLVAGSDVPEWASGLVGAHLLADDVAEPQAGEDKAVDYSKLTVAELHELIEGRNAERGEGEKLAPAGTKKDELIAAIVADDQR